MYVALLIAIIGFGCGSNSSTQSTNKDSKGTQPASKFSATIPSTLNRHWLKEGKLRAELTIVYNKDGTVVADKQPLTISGNTVTGEFKELTADASNSYTFTIDYYITRDDDSRVKIATGSVKHFVEATPDNKPREVKIITIYYLDDDRDGFTNLAELELGTYTKSGEQGIRPNAELPRSSTNYTFIDTMGITPSDGKTTVIGQFKSTNYSIDVNTSVAGQSKSTNYTIY
jgi:hypothetical protein